MIDTKTESGRIVCTRDGRDLAEHDFFMCCGSRACGPHAAKCPGGPTEGARTPCGKCSGRGWHPEKPSVGEASEV